MAALVITATDPDAEWAYTVLDTLARAALHDQHAPNGVAATPPTPQPAGSSPPSPDSSDGVLGTPPTGQSAGSAGPDGVPGTPPTGQSAGSAGPDGVLGTPPAAGRPSLDQVRAEVFFRLLDRAVTDPTFPTQHGRRRIETQVVIGLDTLLGLRDDPATINGRSVPAEIARELATGTTALRRLVTDPVTGHLLDYGTRREPPAVLTEYLLARDQECRVPHCHIRATASDLDHAVPREHGGPTNTSNLGALSRGHHTPKTAGWTDIVDSRADGSAVYVTILGQRIPIPPRPVLGDPPEPSPDTSTIGDDDTDATDNHHVTPDDDPPPF
jgi:hypothetical protein